MRVWNLKKNKDMKRGASTPIRQLHKIICFLRREHHYHEEIVIDNDNTESRCKCGAYMAFQWDLVGGYKQAGDLMDHLKRKRRWA